MSSFDFTPYGPGLSPSDISQVSNDNFYRLKQTIATLSGTDGKWHVIGATNEPAFTNSWVNYNTANFYGAAFYKDAAGFVHLRGLVKDGSVGAGVAIFTLPVNYRPLLQVGYAVNATNAFGNLRIENNGKVCLETGTNTFVFLDGITFYAEQ